MSKTESELNTLFRREFAQYSCYKRIIMLHLRRTVVWPKFHFDHFLHASLSVEKLNKPKLKFCHLKHQHKLCVGQKKYKKAPQVHFKDRNSSTQPYKIKASFFWSIFTMICGIWKKFTLGKIPCLFGLFCVSMLN